MTINKYLLNTMIIYCLVFLSPALGLILHLNKQMTLQLTTFSYLVGAVLLIVCSSGLKDIPLIEKNKQNIPGLTIVYWGVAGIALALSAQVMLTLLEQALFRAPVISENTAAITDMVKKTPLFLFSVSLAGPIMEEFVFRRSLIAFLSQYLPISLAAIISASLFSLAHNDGHYLIYFALGMIFYALYKKTGSIWTPVLTHCGMNLIVITLQLLVPQ